MSATDKPATQSTKTTPNVQGEGDYDSARRYDKDTEKFLKGADVQDLARRAAPQSKEEADELKKAEEIGRSHRKDPAGSDSKSISGTPAPSQAK